MPDIEGLEFVVVHLWRVGPLVRGEALSFVELDAWDRLVGAHLSPWESQLLRSLSGEYLECVQAAKSENCPSPFVTREPSEEDREDVARRVGAAFRGFITSTKAKQ